MHALKKLHPHLKEVANGAVALAAGEVIPMGAPLVKRALFCRTGLFDGMYGEVEVTPDLLKGIAERYNETKANKQNDNDYAPILTDHIREVDRIKGRALAGMTVEPWVDPETGKEEVGLYGDLRIDDDDAKAKVEKGQYAHLSISFDEETFEFFEISFVAVEAARGSMVLSKISEGGKMDLSKKLATLSQKHEALARDVKLARTRRSQSLARIVAKKNEILKDLTQLQAKQEAAMLSAKAGQLKGRFHEFVRGGKMNPAELSKLDFKGLASLNKQSLDIVLAAYENREVSTDVHQYGQAGQKVVAAELTPKAMMEAVALQKAGKGKGVSLSAVVDEVTSDSKKKLEGDEDMKHSVAMGKEDWEKALAEMDETHAKMGECMDKIKSLGEEADKISDEDKKDGAKENEGNKDLAADDDEDKDKNKDKGE